MKEEIKKTIQIYFRNTRPDLLSIGFTPDDLDPLDDLLQNALRLTADNNARSSYMRYAKKIKGQMAKIDGRLNILLGETSQQPTFRTETEKDILGTLSKMIPSAASSFQQASADLEDTKRFSFRGPATELREALRETLDYLAPDEEVKKTEGFKLEKDRSTPTMRQKVHFLLKSRGRTRAAMASPEDAVITIERGLAELARSVYSQGSLSTHVANGRREVMQLKRYVEAVLCDILEIE